MEFRIWVVSPFFEVGDNFKQLLSEWSYVEDYIPMFISLKPQETHFKKSSKLSLQIKIIQFYKKVRKNMQAWNIFLILKTMGFVIL